MFRARMMAVFALGLLLGWFAETQGQDEGNHRLDLTTERVIVFKDGYCLVVKEGIATTDQHGVAFTEQVPDAAILGSFWAIPETGSIRSMIAGWHEREEYDEREITCSSVAEILAANLGRSCMLRVGQDTTMQGTICKLLARDDTERQEAQLPDQDASPAGSFVSRIAGDSASAGQAKYFVLATEAGDVMVNIGEVRHLTIEGMQSTIQQKLSRKVRRKRLSLHFDHPNAEVRVKLMYFRPGVRWIPTYRVNLTDAEYSSGDGDDSVSGSNLGAAPKVAELAMQCELLNEAEDFKEVPFHVVVGVPNFRFRDIPSPMVLGQSVRSVLAQTTPQAVMNNNFSNAAFSQRSSVDTRPARSDQNISSTVDLPEASSGEAGNDLYVYELRPLTLKKGERATIPLQRSRVPYRDIYTWDVQVTHSPTFAASDDDTPSPLVLSKNEIWRHVELINVTDTPWTTGAVMLNDGFQPLAQDLLTYTSAGNVCRVPVTIAVDVHAKLKDREVDRELQSLRWRGNGYARVEGQIEIEVTSGKAKAIPLEIDLRFGGKATSVTDDGEINLSAFRREDWGEAGGDAINQSSRIQWRGNVSTEEPFTPKVAYHYWIRY